MIDQGQDTTEDFFFGGGHKGYSFDNAQVGVVFGGKIVEQPYRKQQLEWKAKGDKSPRLPLWWENNKPVADADGKGRRPVEQIVVPCAGQPDPSVPGDNGVRAHYVAGRNMTAAVKQALAEAGARRIEVGGELYVRWSGGQGNVSSPREYQAKYIPPANVQSWDAEPVPVQPAQRQFDQPPYGNGGFGAAGPVQPPAQSVPAGWSNPAPQSAPPAPAQPQTIPPAAWALMSPEQQAAMAHLAPAGSAPAAPAQSQSAPASVTGW